jgi:phage shock protein E
MTDFVLPIVPHVDADTVKKAIDTKTEFLLLDVRTRQEYCKEHINKSINIPVDEVSKKVEQELPDKDKTIFVYCFSGSRSAYAVETLVKLGYSRVFDMKHGLLAWRAKSYPL